MYIPCSYSHSDPVRSGSPPRPSAPPFAFRCTAARRTPPPSTVAGRPPARPAGGSFSAGALAACCSSAPARQLVQLGDEHRADDAALGAAAHRALAHAAKPQDHLADEVAGLHHAEALAADDHLEGAGEQQPDPRPRLALLQDRLRRVEVDD